MNRKKMLYVCSITAIGMLGLASTMGIRHLMKSAIPTDRKVIMPEADVRIDASGYRLSGPYMYNNLTIYLVHGRDREGAGNFRTLSEAMDRNQVVVHETGQVNELAIENLSDERVFVQSGDIVKGGKQDRVLAVDMILQPRSGRISIDSFCVEHGRWSGREAEPTTAFSSSRKTLSSKDLKIAAKHDASQTEVWNKVAETQKKLSQGIVAASTPPPDRSVAGGSAEAQAFDFSIASMVSASSLQLSLENKRLEQALKDYVGKLTDIVNGQNDVIGYVFAINGKLNSADVYASTGLFKKLWPRLLEAAATEAIGEFDKQAVNKPVDINLVKALLDEAESGKAETQDLGRMMLIKRVSEQKIFFETRNGKKPGDWVHRNYLTR